MQFLTGSHIFLCNLVLPYTGAFLVVCAGCVPLEVVHLVTINKLHKWLGAKVPNLHISEDIVQPNFTL